MAAERAQRLGMRVAAFVSSPVAVLLVLFVGPLVAILATSFVRSSITGAGGLTLENYATALRDPLYVKVLAKTAIIATLSMGVMLGIAIPLGYLLAFRAGRAELPLLLLLVLSDELNPIVKVYAWRMLLGRQGLINDALMALGVISRPIDALLFSDVAVVIVLSVSWITYTTIPIYASLKAIDPSLLEAAGDLGAGILTTFRKLILPLAAPGIFVSLILVYIPLFSEFATPALVGGTSGYMIGNVVQEQILELGNWGVGSALSVVLLLLSGVLALASYRLSRLNRLGVTA